MNFDAVKNTLIAEAEGAGLAEYEVYFMESSGMSADTLKDEISSFSSSVGGGVSFRCIVDGHMGSASSELLTDEEMCELVHRAIANARAIENDDKAILFAGSERYASVELPEVIRPDGAQIKRLALDIQRETYSQSEHVVDGTESSVFFSDIHMELMNSHGLRLSHSVAMSGAYAASVVQKDGESQEAYDTTLDLSAESLKKISAKATETALSKIGASEIPSGKYDVIISARQMRSLLSSYSSIFSAKNVQLGLSLLKGKEGEAVASDIITVIDDPMRKDSPMQTPFDGEGVATYKKSVIEHGKLKTFLYDLATADRAGVESTGNGQRLGYSQQVSIRPFSFYIEAGDISSEELLAKMGDGLYITEFKGMHAACNAVTGDFSIESAGYMVRGGKLCEAVKSFTVAGNFLDLMKGIEAISNTVEHGSSSGFTSYGSPDVLVRGMSVAGKDN